MAQESGSYDVNGRKATRTAIGRSEDDARLAATVQKTTQEIEKERERALAAGEIKNRTGVNQRISELRALQQLAQQRLNKVRTAAAQNRSVQDVVTAERTSVARERSNRARRQRQQEQFSSQNTSVQAGTAGSARDNRLTRQTRVADGVYLARSEQTGRSVLIREGGVGRNERIRQAYASGNVPETDTSVEGRFYMAATPTQTRRIAGLQYQPPPDSLGVQPNDQAAGSNFPYFTAAQGNDGRVPIPVEQRPGLLGDYTRFERRIGRRFLNTEASDPATQTGSPAAQRFKAGVAETIVQRPITTALVLPLAGYALATAGTAAAATSATAGAAFRGATLFGSTLYVGSVGAQAAFSGDVAGTLGREAPKALGFGAGFYAGSGSRALLGVRGARPTVSRPGTTVSRSAPRPSDSELFKGYIQVTDRGVTRYFNPRTGREVTGTERLSREIALQQSSPRAPSRLRDLVGNKRGQAQLLEPPLTRSRLPRTVRDSPRASPRLNINRFRTVSPVTRPVTARSLSPFARATPRVNINRFRTSLLPGQRSSQDSSFLSAQNTGQGQRFGFDVGLGFAFGGAIGLGLLTPGRPGRPPGSPRLGEGSGGFGRGSPFFNPGGRRSAYTPSFAALELGVSARGRPRRGRRFTGLEIRPVFTGGGL